MKIIILLIFKFILNYSSLLGSDYSHGIAMHGDLKYKEGFKKFDYADANAFKGGQIKLSSIGTFDNLNPYILKGVAAWQTTYLFETLMKSSFDEPLVNMDSLLKVYSSKDRSWVKFKIRKEARFSDGSKIKPEDVIFSFNTLISKGHPAYKSYYKQVDFVEKISIMR